MLLKGPIGAGGVQQHLGVAAPALPCPDASTRRNCWHRRALLHSNACLTARHRGRAPLPLFTSVLPSLAAGSGCLPR